MCLEPRNDAKFECFSPLNLSNFTKSLLRQNRVKQAVTEMARLAHSEPRKKLLETLILTTSDVALVSWENINSPTTTLRQELLDKWKIEYKVIQ